MNVIVVPVGYHIGCALAGRPRHAQEIGNDTPPQSRKDSGMNLMPGDDYSMMNAGMD